MFPGELLILTALAVTEDGKDKMLIRSTDVTGECVGLLCDSLATRGYLEGSTFEGFQLTPKGKEVMITFPRQNKSRVNDMINVLKRLGIEKCQGRDKMVGKAVEAE